MSPCPSPAPPALPPYPPLSILTKMLSPLSVSTLEMAPDKTDVVIRAYSDKTDAVIGGYPGKDTAIGGHGARPTSNAPEAPPIPPVRDRRLERFWAVTDGMHKFKWVKSMKMCFLIELFLQERNSIYFQQKPQNTVSETAV